MIEMKHEVKRCNYNTISKPDNLVKELSQKELGTAGIETSLRLYM